MNFYKVYVILLDAEVKKEPDFSIRNRQMKAGGRCYYAGQTSHTRECRFKQHKSETAEIKSFKCKCDARVAPFGTVSNKLVFSYGIRLCPEIYTEIKPVHMRHQAEELEKQLAQKLQSEGHGVYWN